MEAMWWDIGREYAEQLQEDFLVVQWLGICPATQGTGGLILARN